MPQVMNQAGVGYTLNTNEVFTAISNMIISQEVFADNLKGTYSSLVDKAKVDGSLYGDTKLYYATDVLETKEWGADAEATNLLALNRPADPKVQAIYLDKFRQISLTLDDYLSKRMWASEGAFSQFQSVMQGWIRETKRVYEATTYNTFIGTNVSVTASQNIEVDLSAIEADASLNTEEKSRQEAGKIAQSIADLFIELKDVSRDFNDYGYMRSYDDSDLVIVWNSKWVNKIRKIDLPTIFHNEGLISKFAEEVLPARYFGAVSSATTSVAGARALEELKINTAHYFAGDVVATGSTVVAGSTYVEDDDIICKVMHKRSVPFMSAFEVGTSFFNPKSLTTNYYLTWGHNTLEHLLDKPFITIKAKLSA